MKSLSLLTAVSLSIAVLPALAAAEQALSVTEMDAISAGGALTNPALAALEALGTPQGTTSSDTSTRLQYGSSATFTPGCNAASALVASCGGGSPILDGSGAGSLPGEVASSTVVYSGEALVSSPGNPEVFVIDFIHQGINNSR